MGSTRLSLAAGSLVIAVLAAGCTGDGRRADHAASGISPAPGGASGTASAEATAAGYSAYCDASPECPAGGVPDQLRRLLHLPAASPGAPCAVAAGRRVNMAFGPALGGGPAYAVIGSPDGGAGVLDFEYPPPADTLFAGSGFGGQKVLWIVRPDYAGPLLIRGGQLGGTNPVRFGEDSPLSELQLPPAAATSGRVWRNFGTEVRLRAAGCYAWQVDGDDFSTVIVFQARIAHS